MANPNVTFTDFSWWTDHAKSSVWAVVPGAYIYYQSRDLPLAAMVSGFAFAGGLLADIMLDGVPNVPLPLDNRSLQRLAQAAVVGAPVYVFINGASLPGSEAVEWKVPVSAVAAWAIYKEATQSGYITDMFESKQ